MTATCGGCDQRWPDSLPHCGACHQTFHSLPGFDKHRVKDQCKHPYKVGMRLRKYRNVIAWGRPGEGTTLKVPQTAAFPGVSAGK